MTMIRAFVLGAALVAGSVATASAADLYQQGGSIKDGYMPAPVSSPSSWYIRADVGHATFADPTIIEDNRFNLYDTRIDNQWAAGGGVGYYFSKAVRGDLTWDHRFSTDVHGNINQNLVNFPGPRTFGMKNDVFLANLYYDFDTRSRFTPYVGIGLGMTHNQTSTGTAIDTCGCGFSNVSIAGASQWSVAGALMAGASVAIRDRLHLDAGYRFLYLGNAHTGEMTGTNPVAGATAAGGDPAVSDIYAHEFRVGIRYDIK